MHSSTSSSESARGPGSTGGVRVLALAALLALGVLGGLEVLVRALGFSPSVHYSKDAWSEVRRDVYGDDKIVLIGGSRVIFAISPPTLEALRPDLEVRQLGVGGTLGAAVLRDLARDEDFRGLVVVSTRAEVLERYRWDSQQGHVDHHRERFTADERLGTRLRTWLTARLAILGPAVSLPRMLQRAFEQGTLPTQWLVAREDRSIEADFEARGPVDGKVVEAVVRDHYASQPISSPDEWLASTETVEDWIRAIQERGGRVALVRFPTSGGHWKADEEAYPRARYWDRLAARTRAITVHFLDDPALAGFELPDDTHIDRRDAPAFTKRLVEVLDERGFFDAPERR